MILSKAKRIGWLIFGLLLGAVGCGSSSNQEQQEPVLGEQYYRDLYHWNASKGLNHSFLGRGINIGNFFESPNYEGEWNGDLTIQASDFKNISEAGFASVRIPVRWSAHTYTDNPYIIEDSFIDRVQEVVDQAIQANLKVIINTHHFNELFYDDVNFDFHRVRLLAFWGQLAKHFPLDRYSENQLVFEFLNEPHDNVTVARWNDLVTDLTNLLWDTHANTQNSVLGQRKVMIGTADWGGPFKLPELELPNSVNADNTIITIHFYEPFEFTHQGAEWTDGAQAWIGTRWLGTEKDQQRLFEYLDAVIRWNSNPARGFEINIGEFGVYSKHARAEDQRAWTAFIAREAEKRNFSWHYWEYSSGFGAYDPYKEQWRDALITSLIPQS
ncbi:endoglucanase [Vibrio alfacsensis]|uniref:glycoside hydrolase family 5 protein n=1 Tax=Vibrio alfacsensis TaxID=1074311 RepID=UPI001BEF5087|nr:glycoside hydrolase family 5 protein [Vibrio alfacsensis]BBM67551.1 endoglucanase [Vibrio alfacsensis]